MSPDRSRPDYAKLAVRILGIVLLLGVWGAVIAREVPAQDEPDRDYWVQRYESLKSEVETLRARVDMLESQYTRAMRRNYPRGEQLDALRIELDESRKKLAEKEEEWEEFPDEARRAGALPGWFRE